MDPRKAGLVSDDFDFREIVKYLTPANVFKWISVIAFGVLAVILLVFIAVYLWGAT